MTTARDVTERDTERAAEIVSQFHFPHPIVMLDCVKDSEQWVQVVAAALSERERAITERCCKAMCPECETKYASPAYKDKYDRWMHKFMGAESVCKAHQIRAGAARRETP